MKKTKFQPNDKVIITFDDPLVGPMKGTVGCHHGRGSYAVTTAAAPFRPVTLLVVPGRKLTKRT